MPHLSLPASCTPHRFSGLLPLLSVSLTSSIVRDVCNCCVRRDGAMRRDVCNCCVRREGAQCAMREGVGARRHGLDGAG